MTPRKVVSLPRKQKQSSPIPPPLPKETIYASPPPPVPTAGEQTAAWLKANRYIIAAVAVTIIVLAFIAGFFS